MRKYMQIIGRFMFTNIGWKFVSVIFAVALWLICMTIIDPVDTKGINVKLTIENLSQVTSSGYVLLNEASLMNTNITVTANGKISKIDSLTSQSIYAYIDLKPIDLTYEKKLGEYQSVSVYVELKTPTADVQLTPSPRMVEIILDKNVSIPFVVSVEKSEPENENYVSMDAVVTPETVTITGPRTIINTIDSVRVKQDLRTATEDVEAIAEPRVYDVNNLDITSKVKLSVNEVNVRVPIHMTALIQLKCGHTGILPEDYVLTGINMDIQYVEVIGPLDEIEAFDSIELPMISIQDAVQNVSVSYNLKEILAQTKFSIKNGTPDQVTVTAVIEKLVTREFIIPIEEITIIGMRSSMSVDELSNSVSITVKGLPSKINNLTPDNLTGIINLNNVVPGINEVEVLFMLPDGITLVSEQPVIEISVTESAAESNGNEVNMDEAEPDI